MEEIKGCKGLLCIKKNTTVKYKDSKLKKGKTYQYKVVAYNRKNKGTSAIKKIVIK